MYQVEYHTNNKGLYTKPSAPSRVLSCIVSIKIVYWSLRERKYEHGEFYPKYTYQDGRRQEILV